MNRTALSLLLPNALSTARLLLGAAFPLFPVSWRLWIVVIAALSDALDGFTARWLGVESETGGLLDPVADKVFVLMLAGTLLGEGAILPLWGLGLLARDAVVTVGILVVALRRRWSAYRRMPPSWLGKCTTAAQLTVILVLVVWNSAPVWVLAGATALSIAAAVDYTRRFLANSHQHIDNNTSIG